MAHSSHGWAGSGVAAGQEQHGDQSVHEETLRRHRETLRAAYEPDYDDYSNYRSQARRQRREASDISVEALDLADYALTLRRPDVARNDAYPYASQQQQQQQPWIPVSSITPHPRSPEHRAFSPPSLPYPSLAASNPLDRPFSALSRDTMMAPPSLVSNGTTSHSSHTNTTFPNHPNRRPFSLPADYNRGPAIFNSYTPPPPSVRGAGTGRRIQLDPMDMDYGAAGGDVSSFPPWARKWYAHEDNNRKGPSPAAKGKRTDLPRSPVEEEIFGPYIPPSAAASQRDLGLLPWAAGPTNDEPVQAPDVPDYVKEERIRMLEKEFGDRGPGRGSKQVHGDFDQVIGGVDEKGHLITAGPKKRATVRWFQAIFALGSAGSGIYGALFIKLKSPAPPSGRVPAYVLYVLSILTPILLFFFFVITPFCLRRNKDKTQGPMANPAGMMVLPVNHPGQTGKHKKGKGKKGGQNDPGSVQVNLIMDPEMFGTGRGRDGRGMPGRYDDDDYDDDSDDNVTNPSSRRKRRRQQRRDREGWGSEDDDTPRPPRRRSVFVGLAMERAWRRARSDLKKLVGLDVVLSIAWMTSFVLILLGNRCPPGTLDGWCDAYNIATACACVLVVLFVTSAFFGIKDLHQSKQSPRTRT